MGSKAEYEVRKAERQNKLNSIMDASTAERASDIMLLDMLDRFVTAVERIADALEPPLLRKTVD